VDAAVHAVKDATSTAKSEASKQPGAEAGNGRKINHPS
jgi:hypothetical protein